jgi:hypothetical protein
MYFWAICGAGEATLWVLQRSSREDLVVFFKILFAEFRFD